MNLKLTIVLLFTLLSAPLAVLPQGSQQELNDQMWEAARKGDAAAVTALLDKGADVNAKFRYGTTALFKAAEKGNIEVVKVLVARGADVSVKDSFYGATAMTWALDHDHIEVVRVLLEKDKSALGEVLMTGAREGKPKLVEVAVAQGGLDPKILTAALATAMEDKSKPEIVEMLKKAGAVPPPQIDASLLQSYAGTFKSEQGTEITVTVQDGKLVATPSGQRGFALMALDQNTFRPVAFDGISLKFNIEAGKANAFALQQGQNTTQFKRVEDTKQP